MNFTKIIFGSVIGAIFSGSVLAIVFYLTERNSNSSTILGPTSDWAWLGLIFGAVCGFLTGAISGAVIISFQLDLIKAMLFGLIFNFAVGVILYIYSGGGWNDSLFFDFVALIIVGVINAGIVYLTANGEKSI